MCAEAGYCDMPWKIEGGINRPLLRSSESLLQQSRRRRRLRAVALASHCRGMSPESYIVIRPGTT